MIAEGDSVCIALLQSLNERYDWLNFEGGGVLLSLSQFDLCDPMDPAQLKSSIFGKVL